jgi:septal ring factor EnvC (AmiA/AmiB activator)
MKFAVGRNLLLMIILPAISVHIVCGQDSADKLRKSREITLQEIEYANKLLLETQGKTKESLQEISLINHRLKKRQEYVLGIEVEVNLVSSLMEENFNSAAQMKKEIDKIKQIYGKLVYHLYKNRSFQYRIMYLLASENLNQLYKRLRTIKVYNNYLKTRKSELEELTNELLSKNNELKRLKDEKASLIKLARKESETIEGEMNEKRKVVMQLKKKQKEIENEIKEKERIARRLESELKRIIDEERRKMRATGAKDLLTHEEKILSTDFEKNEGRLPWPTERGVITGQYGEHQHPDYKSVTIRNEGVYIATSKGESARSIFKGVVSRVFTIPGENYTVLVKHGEYYTLYHNLINVKVKAGQQVNTKETIGTVFTNEKTRETVLYFQVWKETEKKNPELWLAD